MSAHLPDEEPELGVAVGPHHGVEAGEDPDGEGHVDAPGLLEDSARGDEDAGADDGAHNDGAPGHDHENARRDAKKYVSVDGRQRTVTENPHTQPSSRINTATPPNHASHIVPS